MDAPVSPKIDAEFDKVYDFFLQIENSAFPPSVKRRHSVIKYAKLPDVDLNSKVMWHEESYSLQPRLRRFVSINEPKLLSTRSLKPEVSINLKTTPRVTKRKIVTIEEDDENYLHPNFSRCGKNSAAKTSSRAVGTDKKEDRALSHRTTSRLSPFAKYSKDTKLSAKSNKKENDIPKCNYKSKYSATDKVPAPSQVGIQKNKEKEGVIRSTKNIYTTSKIDISKSSGTHNENDKELCLIKKKLAESWSNNTSTKKIIEKQGKQKSSIKQTKSKASFIKDFKDTNKPVTVIHVPLDDKFKKREKAAEISESVLNGTLDQVKKVDCSTEVEKLIFSKDMNVGTEPLPTTIDEITEIDTAYETICKCVHKTNIHSELNKTLDSLDIPNLTLINNKISCLPKENVVNTNSKSLPNLKISMLDGNMNTYYDATNDPRNNKSTSYIISRATLTYTTKQEINFHVVGKNENVISDIPTSPLSYPMNVVSLFKKEFNKKNELDDSEVIKQSYDKKDVNELKFDDIKHLSCPCTFDSSKLVKPSDIINTIEVRNGLLQSDSICAQFQRELNFIDSFFESLQYLEHCSLGEKSLSENNVESWINKRGFDLKKLEYGLLLPKSDNETDVDDTETMASKSLCLLNLLIRDEQRRANNLLFVLKMGEDALKDFTKSQILWLEDKKKQDNIDISTLKKKQRGALLKLQHECGEMQRMRKALLTLSQKRKAALIKTKKNIQLKITNNLDVNEILSGNKKIRRKVHSDRSLAPIKCFDLSSSGCDDSTTSRPRSEDHTASPELAAAVITSAEKSIQTGDGVPVATTVDQSTATADENYVVVDGGYLNILFHNLSLPQIFSGGKQYEVNEEALKNIVNSVNSNRSTVYEGGDLDRFMDQIKNHEVSSSPSTARSLVDEFDSYYKVLVEEEKGDGLQAVQTPVICEVRDSVIQVAGSRCEEAIGSRADSESGGVREAGEWSGGEEGVVVVRSVAGPLPVPAGAAAVPDACAPDATAWPTHVSTSSSSSDINSSSGAAISSVTSIVSPVLFEAEELRRQQLAIEREIKALEQQQCQLLVVREIPDKPPPPYTPPTEIRAPKLPRMFAIDDATERKIRRYIAESPKSAAFDASDPFDAFLKDFCKETLASAKQERSDKPWHSCNLLPQKPAPSLDKKVNKTTAHLADVLKGVTPTVVSGVGARRSDHIDDILFAEWRRCEPEWTALHSDEALVKNQLFESIFQRILTETVDEYKRAVLASEPHLPVTL